MKKKIVIYFLSREFIDVHSRKKQTENIERMVIEVIFNSVGRNIRISCGAQFDNNNIIGTKSEHETVA